MELVELRRARRINGPSEEPRPSETGKQSILAASINLQSSASSSISSISSSPHHERHARGNHQTGAKLIFSGRPQQDTRVLEVQHQRGSSSSGSLPLGPRWQASHRIAPVVGCGGVGVVVVVGFILVVASSSIASTAASAELEAAATARSTPRRLPPAMAAPLPHLQNEARRMFEMLGTNLIQSLASVPRRVPTFTRPGTVGLSLTSAHQRNTIPPSDRAPPPQTPLLARRPGRLMQMLSRLSRRIGARNSIRFHNAFRDLAWQLLASMSMPTPIIYELRRRQLYSPEEDQWNDSLASKNTSMTIRSKRHLQVAVGPTTIKPQQQPPQQQSKRSRADDEEEEESVKDFRDRLRLRLEDLVSLSRRSLFGRVIRLPSLFPFKRHQQEDNIQPEGVESDLKPVQRAPLGGLLPILKLRGNNKRDESADHQKIFIDGKQYYIDDDGELKELTG